MLGMYRSRGSPALCAAALAAASVLAASPSRADIVLSYDLAGAHLVYDASALHLSVTADEFSSLRILKENTSTFGILDSAVINNNGSNLFNFNVSLDLVDQPGANNWTATGTVRWTDLNTSSEAVRANFTSTAIVVDPATRSLQIAGVLTPTSGTSLLVNRGSPWVFDGSASFHAANEDGIAGNLFIADPEAYGGGSLTTLKFGLDPGLNLDRLFGQNREFFNGNVKGAIIPAPAAALLGALGFSAVVAWRRREA